MSNSNNKGVGALQVAEGGDFVVTLPCEPAQDCPVRLSRAQLARVIASFDVLDRVGPQFRLSDRVSVEVALDDAQPAGAEWMARSVRLISTDGQLAWQVSAAREAAQCNSLPLPIHDLLQFRPAVRCRCAALVNTVDEAAARATVAQRLQADLSILEVGPLRSKVGFVDEHQFARSVDIVRGVGIEACKVSFELVMKVETLEQAGRAAALEIIATALERAVPQPDAPQIIGLSQASHCVLTVSHPQDPPQAHFPVPRASEPQLAVG